MLSQLNLGIFGGDLRQVYMAEAFLEMGYRVFTYKTIETIVHENCTNVNSPSELFGKCKVLIGPIPLSRDLVSAASTTLDLNTTNLTNLLTKDHILIGGIIPSSIVTVCNSKGIPYFDLMKDEQITILNAIATAEGAILEAIKNSNINLHGSKSLVLGYGRCAKVLAAKLKGLDTNVIVAARSQEALAYAEAAGHGVISLDKIKKILPTCDFIFNSIPAMVLDSMYLSVVNPAVTIIDIASAPGGVDFEYAMDHNINARLCLGLPGKVSPKTSADILVTKIVTFMKERSDQMTISGKNVGVALTGSYCTFDKVFPQIEQMIKANANVYTIFSERSQTTDTRFGDADDWLEKARKLTGHEPITTIVEAEKLGPNNVLDIVVVAPCTGNTLAKMANAITDSAVLMTTKGLLRNGKPAVFAISTNDALSNNLKNIGLLINSKNVFFVPFSQDNFKGKPYSMVAHFDQIIPTLEEALEGRQLQPIIRCPQ